MRYLLFSFLLGVYLLFVYGYIRKRVLEKSKVKLSALVLPILGVCAAMALILQTDYSKLLLKTGKTTLSPQNVSFFSRWILGDEYMLPEAYHIWLTVLSYIIFIGTLVVIISKGVESLLETKRISK